MLLHGLTGHARTWDHLARALQPDFRVIALDQRGHGDSQWAAGGDYSVGAMAADVGRLADHLGLGRFLLLGLSRAGRMSIAFAGAQPERAERTRSTPRASCAGGSRTGSGPCPTAGSAGSTKGPSGTRCAWARAARS